MWTFSILYLILVGRNVWVEVIWLDMCGVEAIWLDMCGVEATWLDMCGVEAIWLDICEWRLHDWTCMSGGYMTGHVWVEATWLDMCEWRIHDWTCVSGGYMTGHVRVEATWLDMCEWRLHDWTCVSGGYMTGYMWMEATWLDMCTIPPRIFLRVSVGWGLWEGKGWGEVGYCMQWESLLKFCYHLIQPYFIYSSPLITSNVIIICQAEDLSFGNEVK